MSKSEVTATSSEGKLSVTLTNTGESQSNNAFPPIQAINEQQSKSSSINKKTRGSKKLTESSQDSMKTSIDSLNALKSIDSSLKSLNKAFLAYSTESKNSQKNEGPQDSPFGSINKSDDPILVKLDQNLPEDIIKAYADLILNNKEVKEEWKTWISEAIDMSDLQKMAKAKYDATETSEEPQKSEYDISDSDKAIDYKEILEYLKPGCKIINEGLTSINENMNGLISQKELQATQNAVIEAGQAQAERTLAALRTNTSDQNVNEVNSSLKDSVDSLKDFIEKNNKTQSEIDKEVDENNQPPDTTKETKAETEATDNDVSSGTISNGDNDQLLNEIEETQVKQRELLEKIDENLSDKNKIDAEVFNEVQQNTLDEQKEKKLDKGHKMTPEKSGGILNVQKPAPDLSKIRNSSIAASEGENAKKQQPNGQKGALDLFKRQETISGTDKNDAARNLDKNLINGQMEDTKKQEQIANEKLNLARQNSKSLTRLLEILGGFTRIYKKVTDENREREIHKLRFGKEEKKQQAPIVKLFQKKEAPKKPKSKKKPEGGQFGILGMLMGLLAAGGKKLLGWIATGLGTLLKWVVGWLLQGIKWLAKQLWDFIKWVGKYLWKGIKWIGGQIGRFLKWVWNGIKTGLKRVWNTCWNWFKNKFPRVANWLKKAGNKVIEIIKGFFRKFKSMGNVAKQNVIDLGKSATVHSGVQQGATLSSKIPYVGAIIAAAIATIGAIAISRMEAADEEKREQEEAKRDAEMDAKMSAEDMDVMNGGGSGGGR